MSHQSHWSGGRLDVSARAGALLAAHANGSSYQPNLLSRASRDQAIISGVAAVTAFGWGTVSHSFLRSLADRLPGATRSTRARVLSGIAVDGVAALSGWAVAAAVRPRPGESTPRSLLRLGATSTSASGAAGIGADLLELTVIGRGGRLAGVGAALASWGISYAATRTGHSHAGSTPERGGVAEEDVTRQVAVPKAAAMGPVVTLALMGLASAESALSSVLARGAARVLGGTANDHRTVGRTLAYGALAGVGWAGLTWATGKLTHAGEQIEAAHADPPTLPEVTGGPGSVIGWTSQSRESRRWLSTVLHAKDIEHVMGDPLDNRSGSTRRRNARPPRPTGRRCCSPRSTAPARWTDRCSRCSPRPDRVTSTTWRPRRWNTSPAAIARPRRSSTRCCRRRCRWARCTTAPPRLAP